jgi:Domain of unknown function (DUF4326)
MQLLNKHKDGSPTDAVYIGRGSPLGNPYVIGQHGTRPEVIEKYKGWLTGKIQEKDPVIMKALSELKEDSRLLCFCHPAQCHGSVIEECWKTMNSADEGYVPVADVYRKWLVHRLVTGHVKTIRDFREREYTVDSMPQRFSGAEASKVFIDLYDEINQCQTFNEGVLAVAEKYLGRKAYRPETDGIDHVNIYSKGRTRLGRMLSNFAPIGFIHPTLGVFRSVEAFWYYTSRENPPESLRQLFGFEAKKVGKELAKKMNVSNHHELVKQAITCKIYQNPDLKQRLIDCDLPLAHYYVFGGGPDAVVRDEERYAWITEYIVQIRENLIKQQGSMKVIVAGSRTFENDDGKLTVMAYDDSGFQATEIVSGLARGPDTQAIEYIAEPRGIPVKPFEPEWDGLGKRAGMVRNMQMGDYADALVALWDGKSKGTKQMIEYMLSLGKPVYCSVFPF